VKLTCKEAARLISDGLDRKLSLAQRTALRLHLAVCEACTRVAAQYAFLRRAAARYAGRDGE
jgi:putative zinc finger protein